MFAVRTKTKSRRFQIPPACGAFSIAKSSVFVTDYHGLSFWHSKIQKLINHDMFFLSYDLFVLVTRMVRPSTTWVQEKWPKVRLSKSLTRQESQRKIVVLNLASASCVSSMRGCHVRLSVLGQLVPVPGLESRTCGEITHNVDENKASTFPITVPLWLEGTQQGKAFIKAFIVDDVCCEPELKH